MWGACVWRERSVHVRPHSPLKDLCLAKGKGDIILLSVLFCLLVFFETWSNYVPLAGVELTM